SLLTLQLALEHGQWHFNTRGAYCWRRGPFLFSGDPSHRKQNNVSFFIRVAAAIFFVAFLIASAPAKADNYPSSLVRLIVPYGAGGIADVTMRLVADDLGKRFGQQFFIDNRPGAGGIVGMQAAKGAAADGYTPVTPRGRHTGDEGAFNA